jgi:hypothetical protein
MIDPVQPPRSGAVIVWLLAGMLAYVAGVFAAVWAAPWR